MTSEQKALIRILKDIVHDTPSEWIKSKNVHYKDEDSDIGGSLEAASKEDLDLDFSAEELDLYLLAELAADHSLLGLFYAHLKRSIPPSNLPKYFREGFDSDIYMSVNRDVELSEVRTAIPSEIPILLMKGMLTRRYYPCSHLRSMGDIDFVIHIEDRDTCDQAMLQLGYDKFVNNHAVWNYTKENIEFEIHNHMFYEELSNEFDYIGYFDGVWEHARPLDISQNIWEPTPEFHLLYMITHHAKHILNKGHGFRGFLDFVFFCQKEAKDLDWAWVEDELKKLQLYDFTRTVFAFCERWFEVKMPLEPGKLEEAFYQSVTEKMFQDGMFGLDNEENVVGNVSKDIVRSGKPYWVSAFLVTMGKVFPSYSNMQLIPWYKFVDGRPYLLPFAWVYRWFYVLTHKFRQGMTILTMPVKERNKIARREEIINNWRL